MTAPAQTPITLPVTNLETATSFYLSALQPLGYQFISKAQHRTSHSSSVAVGIGPSNTTRVDLFLSESKSSPDQRHHHRKAPHVVFPAASRIAVRDFYAAALDAGGRPVSPPATKEGNDGLFSTTIQDVDGNKVEVCFGDPVQTDASHHGYVGSRASVPAPSDSIHDWRDPVAGKAPVRDVHGTFTHRVQMAEATARPNQGPASRGRRSSVGSDKRTPSPRGSTTDGPTSKAVVGTLLGAAAGAAVVYAFTKENSDSKAKEEGLSSRSEGRDRLKDEARERAYALAWREKAAKSRRERSSQIDRDSGYYSTVGSQRRGQSPDAPRPRAIAYPRPRRRSSFNDRDRESFVSSSHTVRPVADQRRQLSPLRSSDNVPQRTLSHRSRQSPPERRRPSSPPPSRQVSSRQPPPSAYPRDQRSGASVRTVRYVPVSAPSRGDKSARSYRSARDVPPSPSREGTDPDSRYPNDEYMDDDDEGDGLDDETVVPDDSISVVSSNAPSHKIDSRARSAPRRGRHGVAAY